MKLHNIEKQILRNMKKSHKEIGGKVFTFAEFGITVAIAPAVKGNNCKFVQFCIAQCSQSDKFNKKRGQFIALESFGAEVKMSKRVFNASKSANGEIDLRSEAENIASFFQGDW